MVCVIHRRCGQRGKKAATDVLLRLRDCAWENREQKAVFYY